MDTLAAEPPGEVSTALGASRLWLTVGHGVLNEVYWPATGRPQIRDLGFIVAGSGFWAEVKRVNRYRVRDAVLIRYRLDGAGLELYPLLAPHLGGSGTGNTAWIAREGLLATRGSDALALVSAPGFARASAGYVGASDGWQDFDRHGAMTWTFDRAAAGNVALMGEQFTRYFPDGHRWEGRDHHVRLEPVRAEPPHLSGSRDEPLMRSR